MFNKIISLLLLIFISPILFLLFLLILIFDKKPILFTQKRIGINNCEFMVYKFRTMKNNIGDIPTHVIKNSDDVLSNLGPFLRRYSLDELPQLINIINGEMSFVGPRPALYNQQDLIQLRTEKGVHTLMPGVTGWAQINGRDELSIPEKVTLDEYYLNNKSIILDIKIIFITIKQILFPKNVLH